MKPRARGMLRLATIAVLAMPAAVGCGSTGQQTSGSTPAPSGNAGGATTSGGAPGITSSLDGRRALPLRIHWQAITRLPSDEVSEVDFLIDGQLGWVEHKAPYFYGDDGNWLVSSFLTPGEHVFTVRALTTRGKFVTDTVRARVPAPPTPPIALTATWTRILTPADVAKATSGQPPPAGRWLLRIGPMGWQLHDPTAGGLEFDVAYAPARTLQMRPTIE